MKPSFLNMALLALIMTLSGCGSSTPTVSQVSVTGADIKIGDPAVTFNAVAKDSSGAVLTGKTFSWNSSNPDVAGVDVNGLVTAKHVGITKITATTDGITGEISSFRVYGLEVIGGVARYSDTPNLYFGMYYRVLLPGTAATPAGTISITGPTGWNANAALAVPYTATAQAGSSVVPNALVEAGVYTATTTVNGQTFSSNFNINKTSLLEFPTNVTPSAVSTSSVTVSWAAVTGADRYLVGLTPNALGANKSVLKTQPLTATLTGTPAVDTTKTYRAFVQASNLNPDQLPSQFNSALQYVPVTF
jgi:Bacterial Ig-like domain (group 2)